MNNLKTNNDLQETQIKCSCGKMLAKITSDGRIKLWCKKCKQEIEFKIEIEKVHEQSREP